MTPERLAFLRQLKAFGEAEDIPNISEDNARFLHFLCRSVRPQHVLEIGTANGYSTIWLADAATEFGGKVTGYEISEPSLKMALKNFAATGLSDDIELIFNNFLRAADEGCTGLFAANGNPRQFDFIFVDSHMRFYVDVWHAVQKFVAPHGVLIFDDVLKFPHKTQTLHDAVAAAEDWERVIVPTDDDDGIMLLQRS